MATWTVTTFTGTSPIAGATTPDTGTAWVDAINAVLDAATDQPTTGYVVAIDTERHLLIPARDDAGRLEAAATRAALERLAAAHLLPALARGRGDG